MSSDRKLYSEWRLDYVVDHPPRTDRARPLRDIRDGSNRTRSLSLSVAHVDLTTSRGP